MIALLGGCATLLPSTNSGSGERPRVTGKPIVMPEPAVTIPLVDGGYCGALHDFVLDIHRLATGEQASLLKKLRAADSSRFFCDKLKTGVLLSQIGRTIAEDDEAVEILKPFRSAEQLDGSERWLISLLVKQSEERRRLHVLLNELGEQLVAQRSLSRTLSTDLLTLRQQLDQLQKIEADINETQQSIAAPAASGDQPATQNPDS